MVLIRSFWRPVEDEYTTSSVHCQGENLHVCMVPIKNSSCFHGQTALFEAGFQRLYPFFGWGTNVLQGVVLVHAFVFGLRQAVIGQELYILDVFEILDEGSRSFHVFFGVVAARNDGNPDP